MNQALGGTLSTALGIAISPTPILGLIAFLTARNGRLKGLAYALGWFAAVWLGTLLLSLAADQTPVAGRGAGEGESTSTWVVALQLVFGLSFIAFAMRTFFTRPRGNSETRMPAWMSAADRMSPVLAFLAGACFSTLNPKNLPLEVSAAGELAVSDLSTADTAIAAAIFALVASVSAFALVLVALLPHGESKKVFDNLRAWLVRHNAMILAAIFGLVGLSLSGQAVSELFD